MGRGSQSLLSVAAAFALLGARCLPAQESPFPKPGADPTGKVVDEQGNPIDGAKVTLSWDPVASAPWSGAIRQVLSAMPLPAAITDRDGEYVLPLSREQRRLGANSEGSFALRIEKEGFVVWNEALPNGLWGFLGSRATLRKLAPFERVRLEVVDPRPGMLAVVRLARGPMVPGAKSSETRSAVVPADGKVEIGMPWVGSPCTSASSQQADVTPLRLEACVILPGRTTTPVPVDPDAVNRLVHAATPNARSLAVKRADGAQVRALRGLYRTEGGEEFWFDADGSGLALDERLALSKVKAEGCVELDLDTGAEEATLEPAVEQSSATRSNGAAPRAGDTWLASLSKLRVRVVDENSRAIEGASVRVSDDAKHLPCWEGPVRTTDAHGVVRLEEVPCHSFRVLAVDEDHLPSEASVVPTSGIEAELTIVLGPQVVHRVRATTPNGRPAAFVVMVDRAKQELQKGRRSRSVLVSTDSLGRAIVRRAPEDALQLQVGNEFMTRPETAEDGTILMPCPEAPPVLLRIPFGASLTEQARYFQGGGTSGALDTKGGSFALLLGGPRSERDLAIYSSPGKVPFLFESSDVTATTPRLGEVALVDCRTPVRRIPIDPGNVPANVSAELEIAPITPHHGGAMVGKRHGNLFRRDEAGKPELALTTRAALTCDVLHPDHLRQKLTIDARGQGTGAETPIRLVLEPAARVELRIQGSAPGTSQWASLWIRKLPSKEGVWFSDFRIDPAAAESGTVRLVVPFGLAPGEYQLSVSGSLKPQERDFTVEATKPVVLEFDGAPVKKGD